jgi:heme oxygenase
MSILREITYERHMAVEHLPFTQYLLGGTIAQSDYVIYLAEMLAIYQHLERLAIQAGLFEGMEELPRSQHMRADLAELAPDYQAELLPSTQAYLAYLDQLSRSDHSQQLFGHVYVRHMGDLAGGQMIAKKVPGAGKYYQFENADDLKATVRLKIDDSMADEAKVCFEFATKFFKEMMDLVEYVDE